MDYFIANIFLNGVIVRNGNEISAIEVDGKTLIAGPVEFENTADDFEFECGEDVAYAEDVIVSLPVEVIIDHYGVPTLWARINQSPKTEIEYLPESISSQIEAAYDNWK